MLLTHDGRDNWRDHNNAVFEEPPDDCDDEGDVEVEDGSVHDYSGIGGGYLNPATDYVDIHQDFFELRAALVQHVKIAKLLNVAQWIRWY